MSPGPHLRRCRPAAKLPIQPGQKPRRKLPRPFPSRFQLPDAAAGSRVAIAKTFPTLQAASLRETSCRPLIGVTGWRYWSLALALTAAPTKRENSDLDL